MNKRLNNAGLTLAGISMVGVSYGLARYTIGLFVPEIRQEYQLTAGEMGLVISGAYFGYLIATVLGTMLVLRFGPKLPIILGGLAATVGMTLMAVSSSITELAFGVIIAGASPGLAYPPYSAVILRQVQEPLRKRVYGIINSGTGFGVAVSAPIALLTSLSWRNAYLMFGAVAIVACMLNYMYVKSNTPTKTKKPLVRYTLTPFFNRSAALFFTATLLFGIASSAYWSFSVDFLFGENKNDIMRSLFWSALGIAGALGFCSGMLVDKFGLNNVNRVFLITIGASTFSLPFIAQYDFLILLSTVLFGSGFVIATAIFGMRSMALFPDSATSAFGLTFFMISLGQGFGPPIIGYSYQFLNPTNSFVLSGILLCLLSVADSNTPEMAINKNLS